MKAFNTVVGVLCIVVWLELALIYDQDHREDYWYLPIVGLLNILAAIFLN